MGKLDFTPVYCERTGKYNLLDNSGEVVGELNDGYDIKKIRAITNEQSAYFEEIKDEYGRRVSNFKPFSSYGKTNKKAEDQIINIGMSLFQMRLYIYLKNHTAAKSNIVKKRRNAYLEPNDIIELFGVKKTAVYNAMKFLQENEIIILKEKKIYFNPYIAFSGYQIEVKTREMFDNSRWNEMRDTGG